MLLVLLQKNYEDQKKKQDGLEQQQPTSNKTGSQRPVKEKNSMVIKGMTFYKAEEESFKGSVGRICKKYLYVIFAETE